MSTELKAISKSKLFLNLESLYTTEKEFVVTSHSIHDPKFNTFSGIFFTILGNFFPFVTGMLFHLIKPLYACRLDLDSILLTFVRKR